MPIGKRLEPEIITQPSQPPSSESSSSSKSGLVDRFLIEDPKYTFDEIILSKATQSQINKALSFKLHNDLVFNQWGLKNTHKNANRVCLNFYGLPGTGKTMAAHAVAHYLGKKLILVNYADIESKYVGDTPKNLVALFEAANEADAVIFFDEADALLSKRVTNMSSSTDTSVNQTRSVLLNILNSYDKTILFATNFIENFDPAFMRRILAHVKFELPDLDGRQRLYKQYIPVEMPHRLDIEKLANDYTNLSGSDIANSILLAAFSAAERKSLYVDMSDMDYALKLVEESKKANSGNKGVVTSVVTRDVSEDYVKTQLGDKV